MKRSVQHAFSLSGIQIPFGADTIENTQSIQSLSQTDYCGNFIYEDAQLSRILTPEGYIETTDSTGSTANTGNWRFSYFLKDHLGNVRARIACPDFSSPIPSSAPSSPPTSPAYTLLDTTDYYPFGLEISSPEGLLTSGNNPYLYNGKELDRMHGLDMYDYGARFYDATLGRWHVIDAMTESYYSWTPYKYAMCNPIMYIDPNGLWDVTVHAYNNREQYGYGVAIVTDRHGNEVARYDVRVNGQHHDRKAKNGDTPTGVYDIPDENMWMSGGSVASYGPNHRLILNPESGEAEESGRKEFRMHGGRQSEDDWEQEPDEPLQKTNGCIRMYDDDIADMKTITDELMANDPEEVGGQVEVINDLKQNTNAGKDNYVEINTTYSVPKAELEYWKNLVNNLFNGNE